MQSSWTTSAGGRPIALYHSPDGQRWQDLQRPIVLIGGVHGDEPEGVALAEAILAWLTDPLRTAGEVRAPWVVIPCLNPDGYQRRSRTNDNGVDLNRNYPASNWSPQCENLRYNPGNQPGSEPEIQAMVQLISQTRPRLLIHCHSWDPCIVCTGSPGLKDAQRLSQCSGYKIVDSIGYPTPGSLSQYGWGDNEIPVICIEESEGVDKATTWQRFAPGLKEIFKDDSLRQKDSRHG